jgi:Zn-dependent protease with chaperone function
MHTQTDGDVPRGLPGPAALFPAALGLGLYLLTLSVEVLLGASIRWLLVFIGAATIGIFLPIGQGAEQGAWLAAMAPLLCSAIALVLPGRGWLWRRRLGTRRPSEEEKRALEDAAALLGHPFVPGVRIIDQPLPLALTRGRNLIISRPLIELESLPAVLAHELGHLSSLDARLTEALARLRLWGDPFAPTDDEPADHAGGALLAVTRWTTCLAGGGSGELLLAPLWATYWRRREYAADAHAASLGMGEDLAQHLADIEQPLDFSRSCLPFNRAEHPPIALRIERLLATANGAVSE